jgi:hypothetical protein
MFLTGHSEDKMTLFKKVWEFVVWVIEEFKERVREGILSKGDVKVG